MKKQTLIYFSLLVLLPPYLLSQKPEILLQHYHNEFLNFKEFIAKNSTFKGDTNIDVNFYYLDIEIGIASPFIGGSVNCILEPAISGLNSFRLDLNSSLDVDSISAPCESFTHTGNQINIQLDGFYDPGDLIEVTVWYHGIPVLAGGYKGLRYEYHDENEPIIATLSTPYLAHYWYPCKDGPEDKADSVYVDITIPDTIVNGIELIAVSNGVLENTFTNGSKKTFQWRHRYPVVTYYVMAAISNYVHFQDWYLGNPGNPFPLDYYVFSDDLSMSEEGVADMPAVIEFFSGVFGNYPFETEKYGMTQLGYYGAIENQTNTIINNMSISLFEVSVHELAHMWFGDMITCSNWHHGWLNEGFATYAEALWAEHTGGFEAYSDNMAINQWWGPGTLYLQNALDTFNIFQGIIYSKGAYVLHMLRGLTGDAVFFSALSDYSQHPDFMYRNASTEDLQAVFETETASDLDFFFDQWVYDEYYPVYHYNYLQESDYTVHFVIKQVQESLGYRPVFEMPIRLKFTFVGGGDTTLTVWNDTQLQYYTLQLENEIASVGFDPDHWILREAEQDPDLAVGISSKKYGHGITFYPNPGSGLFYIIYNENFKETEMMIYDMQGRLIMRENLSTSQHTCINLSFWKPGVYYYRVIGNDLKCTTGKVILTE